MQLSISRAWDETAALLKRDFGLLFTIAFALNSLPMIVLQALVFKGRDAAPSEPGAWMLFFIPVMLLVLVGTLSITSLVLRPATIVGDAFLHSFRRFPAALGAHLILLLVLSLLFFVVMVVAALFGQNPATMITIGMLLWIPLALFIGVRLMFIYPVAVAEAGDPLEILRRSWTISRFYFWKLFTFLVLTMLAFMIVFMAIGLVGGSIIRLLAGSDLAFVLELLLGGVAQAAIGVIMLVLIAKIYDQLANGLMRGI